MSTRTLRLGLVFLAALFPLSPALASGLEEPTVIYLVRHAEKKDAASSEDPKDPDLTTDGEQRAEVLGRLLSDAGITTIYSTDTRRTRRTVMPLADRLGLEIQSYDPGDLVQFAEELRSRPGRHVVSGHSNTTPPLVELLGGDPGPPIVEATEYDRLYILIIGETVTTILLRYQSH